MWLINGNNETKSRVNPVVKTEDTSVKAIIVHSRCTIKDMYGKPRCISITESPMR